MTTEKPYTRADVELVERAIHDVTPPIVDGCVNGRDLLNAEACAVLDALVERGQGLAPVIAHQWSVRYPDGFVDGGSFTEAGARRRAAELCIEPIYRAVGPWIAAEEPA